MSSITDIIITCSVSENEAIEDIHRWCRDHNRCDDQQFGRLDTKPAGGNKVFTTQVWAMAGNYFPWRELSEAFPKFRWNLPELAVMVMAHESDLVVVVHGDGG